MEVKIPSPLQEIHSDLFEEKEVRVFVKRDDLIHPVISGNKWRKLKFNVEKFHQSKSDYLLTFGGAYSNHIAATARACKELGVPCIGIIRGDELNASSNSTLQQAAEDGMNLIFTKREEYDLRDEKYYHEELRRRHGNLWIVPEGGSNYYGMMGCMEIPKEIDFNVDYIFTAAGTGTTAAGLFFGGQSKIHVVSALKGGDFLFDEIKAMVEWYWSPAEELDFSKRVELLTDYHFGGYAKHRKELVDFMNAFYGEHEIPLDKVYTAKMFYALYDQLKQNKIPKGSTIVALHTGGLQGNQSISEELLFD